MMNSSIDQFFDLGQYSHQQELHGHYDLVLVSVSIFVAFIASFAALKIFDRALGRTSERRQLLWTGATAVVAGIGVWSMHFIGMFAFELPISMSHSVGLTLLSIVPAILGNFAAYRIQLKLHRQHRNSPADKGRDLWCTMVSGAALGAGIGLMHYMGMEAMLIDAELRYSVGWFITSVAVAVVLGILAMSTYHGYLAPLQGKSQSGSNLPFLTAAIISVAISGMHYVAMLAARFYSVSPISDSGSHTHSEHLWLVYAVTILVFLIAIFALASSNIDRRLQRNQKRIMQSDEKIRQLAYNDTLTGLPNRRSLIEFLQHTIVDNASSYALIMVDIDQFKVLNSMLGSTIGDLLLLAVTERLQRANPEKSLIVSRPSSNEFAMVIKLANAGNPASLQSEAFDFANQLQQALHQPYTLKDYRHRCSMSIGIAIANSQQGELDLIGSAGMALAEAKRQGQGHVEMYHPELSKAIVRKVRMERDLRTAIEKGDQLELYLQPQVDGQRQVVGAEALIRWNHPEHGFISPADFIPLAEESGLIISLGDWINKEACKIAKQWQQLGMGHLVLSINVSASQFQQLDFVDKLHQTIRVSDVSPSLLKLELTESVLMQNVDDVIRKIEELKQLGLTFALDDFGTGYSSLSYLMKLPFDVLKIDVSFVRDMLSSKHKQAIVKTIVQLAHNLELSVIAEGVETEEQFDYLKQLGCDQFQGYLFSKPVAKAEFSRNNLPDNGEA